MIHHSIRALHLVLNLSHCAHGAAWLSAIGAMVIVLRIRLWLPPPFLAFCSGRCRHGGRRLGSSACSIRPVSLFFFFPLIQKERRKKYVPCSPVGSAFGGFDLGPVSRLYSLFLHYITHNSRA
jgi:hypothetical protein